MVFLLPSHPWRISYSSNENNPIADFYIPALERAVQYDRKSGFFNSAILSKVARGLGAMLYNEGKMRLIMGCQFSPQDLTAIQQGYELKEAISTCLDRELEPPKTFVQLKHFEILSWLIAHHYLEIKIAIPLKDNGLPEPDKPLDTRHIFHEKTGIFTDVEGNQLAFNGSNNESISGWEQNVESFHVYCSWEGVRDLERVNEEQYRFDQLWHDLAPNVRVFNIPEAVKRKLLRYTPTTKPTWTAATEQDTRPISIKEIPKNPETSINETIIDSTETQLNEKTIEAEKQQWQLLKELHKHPGCLDYCLKSIPITPWIHQLKILRQMIDQWSKSAMICDEVGLGKTISTGVLLRYLLLSKQVKRVLILVPASVQPQWHEELREKFNLHFWSYDKGIFKNSYGETCQSIENPWNEKELILASSHLVRRKERTQELLDAENWDLVVLDEAHHARRKSPQKRDDTPNSLLRLMRELKDKTRSLLLLSATPMQIDTIEIFDLLSLVDLKGEWQYQDNFCDYFDSLAYPPDRLRLEFWQRMSKDYFQQGGQLCPLLEQQLSKQDRLLLYRLKDIWQQGMAMVNHKQLCQDNNFINASRQFLTHNTPLKDLMFRHTRDTLREYYRRGILDKDVPRRVVFDNAIALESNREVPLYQAVSNYVRHFYNLAQQEQRQGLGFLMTLYRRRLTSSFYAIKKSLERRLEGISITEDDLTELDEADDAIITGLESYLEPTDPAEINYLEDLLRQFENTGEDTKLSAYIEILRHELTQRESAITFFQYTDTMDYVRDTLVQLYGNQVACYSGRGGELYEQGQWRIVKKEQIKRLFKEGVIKVLLCTKSASEGLNLQTCGVILMYSMPWNPMQVEQQIGRLDRIGQVYPTIRIHNFYYDGTVEAKVYRRLRDRIQAFETVVGNLQPILAQVPTFIELQCVSP
ncbi:SNF2-related protein [Crocosphaera chwakensis]|uniref:Putative DEAD/H helicase n=1 Tax=Crocosphaera chwakensis CCY0110 TaxID=391612 RepID=A3IZM4_9CHRO|nr:SNF2-related protein [Crocosphaera chwakensis]EAZ88079.1 putative DEAD/H helicase [Crocosphaera chwakensis CCY0110]